MKPNVFCVGAGKCGTTWLYGLMRAHPECCASEVKETMYFEHYFDRGVSWFENHFKIDHQHQVVCEVSNTYIFSPDAAKRIHDYNPEAKIVITVRNPIERAVSHYLFLKRNGNALPDFERAVRQPEYEHLLWRGLYFQHMQPYLARFPVEQVAVLLFEDLVADKEAYGRQFLEFAGLDPVVPQFNEDDYRLGASKPRSVWAARLLKVGANAARDLRMDGMVQRVKSSFVPRLAYKPLAQAERPEISPTLYRELADYFRADIERLSDWIQRDLVSLWLSEDSNNLDISAEKQELQSDPGFAN